MALTTLYDYFVDLGEIVLAILEPIRREMDAVVELLERPWPTGCEEEFALQFVAAHLEHTRRHSNALRLRNILADSGDERFQRFRTASAVPLMTGFTRKIRLSRGPGVENAKRSAALGVTLTLAIERAATVATQNLYPQMIAEAAGTAFEGQSEALAEIIASAIRNPGPPAKAQKKKTPA